MQGALSAEGGIIVRQPPDQAERFRFSTAFSPRDETSTSNLDRVLEAAAPGFSVLALCLVDPDDLEGDPLQVKLFTHTANEVECFRVRLVHCAQLNLDVLVGELRIGLAQLSVENEREIGVKFFLKLKELPLFARPRTGFIHRKNELVHARVMRESVKNSGMLQAVHRWGNQW